MEQSFRFGPLLFNNHILLHLNDSNRFYILKRISSISQNLSEVPELASDGSRVDQTITIKYCAYTSIKSYFIRPINLFHHSQNAVTF